MKKNFLKTIAGAVLAVSTLVVLAQVWVSAQNSAKAESTQELMEAKDARNPTSLFPDGSGCESEDVEKQLPPRGLAQPSTTISMWLSRMALCRQARASDVQALAPWVSTMGWLRASIKTSTRQNLNFSFICRMTTA